MAAKEEIRAWVYEFLRKKSSVNQTPSTLALGLGDIELEVKSRLQRCNEMSPTDYHRDISNEYKDFIREIVWGLVLQGIVVPGANTQQAGLPFFQITNWGKQCLQDKEYLPYDAGLYIQLLKTQVPQVDGNVVIYLQEALLSFRAGAYLSSAVMAGVAAEKVLLLLRDQVHTSFSNQASKDRFEKATFGKPIKQVYEEIWKKLDPVHDTLASDLGKEDVKAELSQIFDLIRKTRNDAGHPTGRQIQRDEAYALLLLFPENCKATYKTIIWLKSNPLP